MTYTFFGGDVTPRYDVRVNGCRNNVTTTAQVIDLVSKRGFDYGQLESVRRMQLQHESMEFFGARAGRPLETCLQEVRACDLVVVLLGHRYGSIEPTLGVSFSEAEYREAFRLGKPCLVYVRDDSIPVLPRFIERDPAKIRLLEAFREFLLANHTVAYFKDPADLAVRVTVDVEATIRAVQEARRARPIIGDGANVFSFRQQIDMLIDSALAEGAGETQILSSIQRSLGAVLMSAGKRNPIAYFCHAESDKELVAQVNEGLTKLNIRCLQSPSEVRTESAFLREITNAFNVADLVVLVVSADLLTTVSARRELDLIIARRLAKSPKGAVLPVLTDNSQLPSVLRDLKSLDLHEMNGEKAAESLMEAVISRLTERAVLFGLKR